MRETDGQLLARRKLPPPVVVATSDAKLSASRRTRIRRASYYDQNTSCRVYDASVQARRGMSLCSSSGGSSPYVWRGVYRNRAWPKLRLCAPCAARPRSLTMMFVERSPPSMPRHGRALSQPGPSVQDSARATVVQSTTKVIKQTHHHLILAFLYDSDSSVSHRV